MNWEDIAKAPQKRGSLGIRVSDGKRGMISEENEATWLLQKLVEQGANVEEIIDAYYQVRMDTYGKRKIAQVEVLKQRVQELSNRARFIQEIVANTIDLRKYTDDADLDKALMEKHYEKQQNKYEQTTRDDNSNSLKYYSVNDTHDLGYP